MCKEVGKGFRLKEKWGFRGGKGAEIGSEGAAISREPQMLGYELQPI